MASPIIASTHELFVSRVRDAIVAYATAAGTITADEANRLMHAKLLYGVGNGTYRGICWYDAWQNGTGPVDLVEIAATGQENFVQLACTVAHELGHVLAGSGTGHKGPWKAAAVRLGFTIKPLAAGQVYSLAMLTPTLRHAVYALAAEIGDGSPAFTRSTGVAIRPRPCSVGIGTSGGKSRGTGSGSRLRKWVCECAAPVIVRVSSDTFAAHCDDCNAPFKRG